MTSERAALDAAAKQGSVTVDAGSRTYTAYYGGKDNSGCDLVNVRKESGVGAPAQFRQTDMYNYRVCNGKVMETDNITPPVAAPEGLREYAQTVGRNAQKYGTAQGSFSGYIVTASALRGQSQCAVEIKIFKDKQLYDVYTTDGCQ